MEYSPDWSRTIILNGYEMVHCPDHPNAWRVSFKGYIYVHRLAVEQHFGRLLGRHEVVHHKNENRLDNRIENLEVMTQSEHARMHQLRRGKPPVRLKCPNCRRVFHRRRGLTHMVDGRKQRMTFCSRRCNGQFNGPRSKNGAKKSAESRRRTLTA